MSNGFESATDRYSGLERCSLGTCQSKNFPPRSTGRAGEHHVALRDHIPCHSVACKRFRNVRIIRIRDGSCSDSVFCLPRLADHLVDHGASQRGSLGAYGGTYFSGVIPGVSDLGCRLWHRHKLCDGRRDRSVGTRPTRSRNHRANAALETRLQPYELYPRSLASIRGFFIGRPLSAHHFFAQWILSASPRRRERFCEVEYPLT